jgi:hypothetical protein
MKIKRVIALSLLIGFYSSCSNNSFNTNEKYEVAPEFSEYWYDGNAEISSFNLKQERYGELREGTAVMIYVTEPFSEKQHTKADNPTSEDPSVLKLNVTKNFVTGIYPYSIMTSIFFPVNQGDHALKVSTSIQEWCGHTYIELIKENDFDIGVMSYFEGERKAHHHEKICHLEDEIWTLLRINPTRLPVGEIKMIPSFSYLRLMHQATQPYICEANLKNEGSKSVYTMSFSELDRSVKIEFKTQFPHQILGWQESYPCVGCEQKEIITSSVSLSETIKVDYWNKNSTSDTTARIQLGLHN